MSKRKMAQIKELNMITKTDRYSYILSNSDLFDSIEKRISAGHVGSTVIVPHVCNNIDLFGAGFAAQVADRYPDVKTNYHLLGKNFLKNNFGHAQFIKVKEDTKYRHKLYFVNMIAQNGIKNSKNLRPLNYAALTRSMSMISSFILNDLRGSEKIEIHAPKFGSGLAGGNWNFISDLIQDIWGNYNIFIYNYKK